jgi:hypothetical protein
MPAPITTIWREPGADPLIRQLIYQMAFTVWGGVWLRSYYDTAAAPLGRQLSPCERVDVAHG